jgi:ABC-type Fe3+-hydroxamate transport system substrate-binding protein
MSLILVVIAVLLALNLVAQQPQSRTLYTPEAEATQQVANSLAQVAEANQQIAASLGNVATAIDNAGQRIADAVRQSGRSGPAPAPASPRSGGVTGSGTGSPPSYEGTIELNP